MSTPTKSSPYMRFASAVADFGDPFYSEERQRDVWNEASAFGFQLLLWGGLVLSAGMLWLGGPEALPYAAALLIVTGFASALTLGYARRLGVDAAARKFRSRSPSRLIVLALVLAVLLGGLARSVALSNSLANGAATSALGGFAIGVVVALVPLLLMRRAQKRASRATVHTAHDDDRDGA
ncbi:MAG: hypothetical protein ACOH17_03340 [Cellulomonas sp.]